MNASERQDSCVLDKQSRLVTPPDVAASVSQVGGVWLLAGSIRHTKASGLGALEWMCVCELCKWAHMQVGMFSGCVHCKSAMVCVFSGARLQVGKRHVV